MAKPWSGWSTSRQNSTTDARTHHEQQHEGKVIISMPSFHCGPASRPTLHLLDAFHHLWGRVRPCPGRDQRVDDAGVVADLRRVPVKGEPDGLAKDCSAVHVPLLQRSAPAD